MSSITEQGATPTPAIPPPPGESSDFTVPNMMASGSVITLAMLTTVVTLVYTARVYTRRYVSLQWGIEDYVCALSWIFFVVFSSIAMNIALNHYGGVHMWDLTPANVQDFKMWNSYLGIMYGPLIGTIKASILLLYVRIFVSNRRSVLFVTIVGTMVICCVHCLAQTIAKIFECVPRERIWDKSVPGNCVDGFAILEGSAIFNLFTDLFIWVLPLAKVFSLRAKRSKKLWAGAIFGFGLIAPITTCVRLAKTLNIPKTNDETYVAYEVTLWTVAEVSVGILCACLPVFPRLLNTVMHSYKTWRNGRSGPRSSGCIHCCPICHGAVPPSPSSQGDDLRKLIAPSPDLNKPLPTPPPAYLNKTLPSLPSMVSIDSCGGLKVPRALMGPKPAEWFKDDSPRACVGLITLDARSPELQSPKARRTLRFCPDAVEHPLSR